MLIGNIIKNILTFRYNPNDRFQKRELTSNQFTEKVVAPDGFVLEQMLQEKIIEELEDYDNISIALSSGIDSQLVFYFIKKIYPNKKINVIYYEGSNDELDIVMNNTKHTNVNLHILRNKSLIEIIPRIVNILNYPIWDAFNLPLFEKARELNSDVLVTGDGADEILGGYTFRYSRFNPASNEPLEKTQEYMKCHERDWVEDQEHLFGENICFDWEQILEDTIIRHFDNRLSTIRQCFMADYNGKLTHNFNPRDNYLSKHFDIKRYSPYLDSQIVHYCNHLSSDSKVVGTLGKIPLRCIADRHNLNVAENKLGFSHDVKKELNTGLGRQMIDVLKNKDSLIYEQGWINYGWIERHITNNTDTRIINKFFQLYALEWWLFQNV